MSKVTDRLYISGYAFAGNRSLLQKHGITHIVNMAYEYDNVFPDEFTYLHIQAKDVLSERLSPWFYEIAAFVNEAKKRGGVTLIHCQLGVSRSATAILACLIINEGMQLSEAFQLLKSTKHDIEPNATFLKELRVLENDIHGNYCLEKLTIMDKCEAPAPLDWKESIAIILASASLAGTPYDKHTKELDCVRTSFYLAKRDSKTELENLMTNVLITGLESFGGGNERDQRARAALGNLLTVYLPGNEIFALSDLQEMLFNISESENFLDFAIDVPIANSWLKGLRQSVKEQAL